MVEGVESVPPSCAECRRAKRKCDRNKPCSGCVRGKLACTYERIVRTPLTRKYLSEVEVELQRTKALLARYENGDQQPSGNDHSTPMRSPRPITSSSRETRISPSSISPAFTLETPPTGDLDWDERVLSNGERLNDGMASLLDRSGYMGPTSGSALLRMADDSGGQNDAAIPISDSARTTPPLAPGLYSLAQLEPFINGYFATYHNHYPIIHEPTFRAQFMEIVPRPHGKAWQVLLYIVATIGCFASSETSPDTDIGLFDATKQRMSIDLLETGNLTLVQALVLVSNYIQKRNRPNSGYNYMGIAKRMAWGLALHKEFPAWREQPFRMELRRRIWHCLAVFDQGAIITFSRPLDMPPNAIEVDLPLNISDGDLTATTTRIPAEQQITTTYTHVRIQSHFHQTTNDIYQRLIGALPNAEEMLRLNERTLQNWVDNIPPYFRETTLQQPKFRLCHAIMQWRWRNFRILMMRPYLMRRFLTQKQQSVNGEAPHTIDEAENQAIQICLDTARESIQMITLYWKSEHQNVLTCWYALYFLFQAVLIPVVSLRNGSRSTSAISWRDDILLALDTITEMNRINPSASRCHAAILSLCGAYLATDISQWESPTNESPQTQMNTLYSYLYGPCLDDQLFDAQNLQMQESSFVDFFGHLGAP